MQGTQTKNNGVEVGGVIDLDALLAARSLKPATVKLMGETYGVRRDLTADETVHYWKTLNTGDETAALAILLVDGQAAAERIQAATKPLPDEHSNTIYTRLMRIAGVLKRLPEDEQDDEQGESSAS